MWEACGLICGCWLCLKKQNESLPSSHHHQRSKQPEKQRSKAPCLLSKSPQPTAHSSLIPHRPPTYTGRGAPWHTCVVEQGGDRPVLSTHTTHSARGAPTSPSPLAKSQNDFASAASTPHSCRCRLSRTVHPSTTHTRTGGRASEPASSAMFADLDEGMCVGVRGKEGGRAGSREGEGGWEGAGRTGNQAWA